MGDDWGFGGYAVALLSVWFLVPIFPHLLRPSGSRNQWHFDCCQTHAGVWHLQLRNHQTGVLMFNQSMTLHHQWLPVYWNKQALYNQLWLHARQRVCPLTQVSWRGANSCNIGSFIQVDGLLVSVVIPVQLNLIFVCCWPGSFAPCRVVLSILTPMLGGKEIT